jgi:hypothetical protein
MTSDQPRRVEVKDDGETVAAAEVTPLEDTEGTVRTSLLPSSGHTPPGSRAGLVDAVMALLAPDAGLRLDLPGAQVEVILRDHDLVLRPHVAVPLERVRDNGTAPAPGSG